MENKLAKLISDFDTFRGSGNKKGTITLDRENKKVVLSVSEGDLSIDIEINPITANILGQKLLELSWEIYPFDLIIQEEGK